MAKTIEQLKAQSAEVKNATVVGENTATRVGTLFTDIVEHVEHYELEQAKIFDVSVYNNGAVFESISALLSSSNLSTLIPTSVRHGGMSIRFIQGSVSNSNNNYVQVRFMLSGSFTDAQFTNVDNWQGVDDKPTAGSENLVKSGGVHDKIVGLEQRGGNIIGNYTEGKLKDYYYNVSLQAVPNTNNGFSCMFIICNHQQLKIRYTLRNNTSVPVLLFANNIDNPIRIGNGDFTQGTHEYDISAYDIVYLNCSEILLDGGFDIIPKDEYYYDYKNIVGFNGTPIAPDGNKKGVVKVSNNSLEIVDTGTNHYLVIPTSVFVNNNIDRIIANIPSNVSSIYPAIVQTDDDNNVIAKQDAVQGNYEVPLEPTATKIFFNYYSSGYNNAYRLPNGVNINETDDLSDFRTDYIRDAVNDSVGYVAKNGNIYTYSAHRYKKIEGKYVKSVKYKIIKPDATLPVIVLEKDGKFDNIPILINEYTIYNLNYECDYIYINFFDGSYVQDNLVTIFKDVQQDYVSCVPIDDVLNKPYVFNGKTALFFGDSITKGYTRDSGGNLIITSNGYPKQFCDAVGMTFHNHGSGGESIYRDGDNNYTLYHVQQAGALDSDYLFVAAGSNDYSMQNSMVNFKGAVIDLFDYISSNYSGEVIVILPINRTDRELYYKIQLDEYRQILITEAIKHKFSVINGASFAFSPIKNEVNSYLLADDAHPTENGYAYYAKMLRTRLC